MGQHAEAAELHRQVLEMRQQVLGDRAPGHAHSMNNLATALQGMGQHAEAAELHRHSVGDAGSRCWGTEHPDTLSSMNNLATALRGHGAACRGGRAAPAQCWR